MVSEDLYEVYKTKWDELQAQGYSILLDSPTYPDLYLAPYAMRMTGDMLIQLPAALDLAIKGARELRYGPTGKDSSNWKGAKKHAQTKGTRKRKNTKVKVEAVDTGEPPPTQTAPTGVGSATTSTRETSNNEGNGSLS